MAHTMLKPQARSNALAETDGTIAGYASLFGREDLSRDVVLAGAFQHSLAARGRGGVKMLFQHDPNVPIGVWTEIHEDQIGLYVKGRLALDVTQARDIWNLIRAGALDGLSIGFRAVHGRRDRHTGIRRLAKIDLWEVSIVTFPLLPGARIRSVKHTPPGKAQSRVHLPKSPTANFQRGILR